MWSSVSLKTKQITKFIPKLLTIEIRKKSIKPLFNMNEAFLRYTSGNEKFEFSFRYVDSDLNVDRQFNLSRRVDESVETFLKRLDVNLGKILSKKLNRKKKKKGKDETQPEEASLPDESSLENVSSGRIFLSKEDKLIGLGESCSSILKDPSSNLRLNLLGKVYEIKYNAPWIISMKMPTSILAGFPVYPSDFEHQFTDVSKSSFTWFRFSPTVKSWEEVGHQLIYLPRNEDIGCKLRLKCVPRNERYEGPEISIDSETIVEAGPGLCPFELRHEFTREKLSGKSFRITSYNILADTYADSEYSRDVLFPYCPAYALNIDYRKLLIIKELLGYKSDVVCLQEVDKKVYQNDLKPSLLSANLDGVYYTKGEISEGLLVLYDTTRFELMASEGILMKENIDSYPSFSDIWNRIENDEAKKRFENRNTSAMVVTLKSIDNPSEVLIVGNTHLYFHPDADHIRLLQSFFALTACQTAADQIKQKHPELNVSIILCGDFNSTPPDGVYQLMTQNTIPEDHKDWKSNEQEVIKNIKLTHQLQLSSACGTPQYTNFTTEFADCLDYIFYENNKFKVTQVVPLPDKDQLQLHSAIPSVVFPSDHVALCSDLKWI